MTIEEAIKHAEEVAVWQETEANNFESDGYEGYEQSQCLECADEHRQLAKWLKELKAHRESWDGMKEGLLEMSRLHEYVSIKHMIQLIDEVRPKECDAE